MPPYKTVSKIYNNRLLAESAFLTDFVLQFDLGKLRIKGSQNSEYSLTEAPRKECSPSLKSDELKLIYNS